MIASRNIILVDSREPWPNHPWNRYLPVGWSFERGYLETGDLALATFPESAIVERKTSRDLATCIGAERERFEKELERGFDLGRLVVVVEGSLTDVVVAARRLHHNTIIETNRCLDAEIRTICILRQRENRREFRLAPSRCANASGRAAQRAHIL